MELSSTIGLSVIGSILVVLGLLSLAGVQWLMRLRIVGAMAVGAAIVAGIGWMVVRPAEVLGAVSFAEGDITFYDAAVCLVLAFLTGIGGYFVAWPLGMEIGPLAVPTGLAAWSFCSGDMTSLLRLNNSLQNRMAVYSIIRWEVFFWLGVVSVGYLGVLAAKRLTNFPESPEEPAETKEPKNKLGRGGKALSILTAVVATIVIGQFGMELFARDVKMFDRELGSVVGQPGAGQIGFAVLVSFGVAAFVVKRFLGVSYIIVALSSGILFFYAIGISANENVLKYMTENWPIVYFPRSICAALPFQIVSFASIGAIAGYWMAVKAIDWQKHRH